MLLNQVDRENPTNVVSQFKVVNCFSYLGIEIVPLLNNIIESNYRPVMQGISTSLNRWAALPMSLFVSKFAFASTKQFIFSAVDTFH